MKNNSKMINSKTKKNILKKSLINRIIPPLKFVPVNSSSNFSPKTVLKGDRRVMITKMYICSVIIPKKLNVFSSPLSTYPPK